MAKRKKAVVGRAKRTPRAAKSGPKPRTAEPQRAESYKHPTAESLVRPDVGTQAQFRKKKPPVTYRYDSSLSPALDWDGQNPARKAGEHGQVAVNVIDDRGNELLVVKDLKEAKP